MADAELKKEAENWLQREEYEKNKGIEKKGFFASLFSRAPTAVRFILQFIFINNMKYICEDINYELRNKWRL